MAGRLVEWCQREERGMTEVDSTGRIEMSVLNTYCKKRKEHRAISIREEDAYEGTVPHAIGTA